MIPALSCSVCKARGFIGERRCPNCHGNGFLIQLENTLVGWGLPLDRFAIRTRRLGVGVNRFIDAVLGLWAGVSALIFFVHIFTDGASLLLPEYWNVASAQLLALWSGLFAIFILVARRSRSKHAFMPVLRRGYEENPVAAVTPGAWESARQMFRSVLHAADSYTPAATSAVENAMIIAEDSEHGQVTPIHLVSGMLNDGQVKVIFARAGVGIGAVQDRLTRVLEKMPQESGVVPVLSPEAQAIIVGAYAEAVAAKQEAVDVTELLSLAAGDQVVADILNDLGISPEVINNVVVWNRVQKAYRNRIRRYRSRAIFKPTGNLDRAMTAVATPHLDSFSYDMTRLAMSGRLPFMVGREKEMSSLLRIIEGGHASAILVGQPGVGKQAILSGLAERMVEEDVPKILKDKRLVAISVPDLIAGATPSEAHQRLLDALRDVARAKNLVLAVEHIEAMVGVSEGGVDLFDIFAAELERGYFFCVATSNPRQYSSVIESRPHAQAFQKVDVPEPEKNEAIQIIMAIISGIEAEQNVYFTYPAIEKAVSLSSRYLHDQFLPQKAIEILKEAAQLVRTSRGERVLVGPEDVASIVSEKSHVPVTSVTESEGQKLLQLEQKLHGRVIGQDEAVKAVSAALRRGRAELRAKNRPIASFLFLGPTGVGKTELAKAVAEMYFGSEDAMIRLDMSEYQQSTAVARLIGVPGATGGGLLTEAVRKKPFALLLLDEFEKAHPDILNIFLQVMDDGRLTDNEGRTIDFTNVIIVATSNAGSQYIQDSIRAGMTIESIKTGLLNEQLKGIYKPELLNRFDGVIVFKPLTRDEIEQVAWLMMGKITDTLSAKGIAFRATDESVRELASIGFDPVFGARPMRRVIQEKVETALADELLKQKIDRRDVVVLEPGSVIRVEKAKQI